MWLLTWENYQVQVAERCVKTWVSNIYTYCISLYTGDMWEYPRGPIQHDHGGHCPTPQPTYMHYSTTITNTRVRRAALQICSVDNAEQM